LTIAKVSEEEKLARLLDKHVEKSQKPFKKLDRF
jgi:hypothetical protein